MRPGLTEIFYTETTAKEGYTPFLYADVLNLVTTGRGNLVDAGPNHNGPGWTQVQRAAANNVVSEQAMAPALALPRRGINWYYKGPGWTWKEPVTGLLAPDSAIRSAWTAVKEKNAEEPGFAQKGGYAYQNIEGNNITLSKSGVETLFFETLESFWNTLKGRYQGIESWPINAQYAILSMAWAMGPSFEFPAFKAAVDRLDFYEAAKQSFFKGGGGTWDNRTGRNAENETAFIISARVLEQNFDPDTWHPVSPLSPDAPVPVPKNTPSVAYGLPPQLRPGFSAPSAAILASGAVLGGGALAVTAFNWAKKNFRRIRI